jgi:hypothetical protein
MSIEFFIENLELSVKNRNHIFLEKLKIPFSMHNGHTFIENNNTRSANNILFINYYNNICSFRAEFPTIAYVFVFSIIPEYI